jgi:hypothetical protein
MGRLDSKGFFFDLKSCIDGFISDCRPYFSTFLIGKFGTLASASAVDGHNWLFPICFGVFNLEQMIIGNGSCEKLKRGLAKCTNDVGQEVMVGVGEVFLEVEHRECMFYLVSNFKKGFMARLLMTISGQHLTHELQWMQQIHQPLMELVLSHLQGRLCNQQLG